MPSRVSSTPPSPSTSSAMPSRVSSIPPSPSTSSAMPSRVSSTPPTPSTSSSTSSLIPLSKKPKTTKSKSITTDSSPPKFLPDFSLHVWARGYRYGLLTVEIKQPNSGRSQPDLWKLANEMKLMLNALVDLGISFPVVCGIWIDGFETRVYKMDLRFNGVYCLIELGRNDLPSSMQDIFKVKPILQMLLELKRLVDEVAEKVERRIKPNSTKGADAPMKRWKRGMVGSYTRVKKNS
ncbi:unnamed protein product [Absidia cylindrospora]